MKSQRSASTGLLDAGLAGTIVLFAGLILASFYAGVLYEGKRLATQDTAQLRAQQQSTQRAEFWLSGQRTDSETRLGLQLRQQSQQLHQEQTQANAQHQTLHAGMRAGTVSVRVPVVPASCSSPSVSGAPVSSAGSAATHAQLDPAAAADLADISHDGDAAIRELNACIFQYNTVKAEFDQWLNTLIKAQDPHAQTR